MKNISTTLVVVGIYFLLLLSSKSVYGHHGFAAHFYPDRTIQIEGVIKQFDYINPHGFLHIESLDAEGEPAVYVCDIQARTQLMRRGFDETMFEVGRPIIVVGYPARRNPYQCEFGAGYFADGSSFTMRNVEGAPQTRFATNNEVASSDRSIFGKWIRPGLAGELSGRGPTYGEDSMTEAGLAVLEDFDPIRDNPVMRCEPGSPIRTWDAPGLTTEISERDGKIYIYHESMDITREIHMNSELPPEDIVGTDMGYSVGYFEGDELVINSTHFRKGVISFSMLNSDQMTLHERVKVLENGRLEISWQINEPLYYAEPLRGSQVLRSTDNELIPYNCVPETVH